MWFDACADFLVNRNVDTLLDLKRHCKTIGNNIIQRMGGICLAGHVQQNMLSILIGRYLLFTLQDFMLNCSAMNLIMIRILAGQLKWYLIPFTT